MDDLVNAADDPVSDAGDLVNAADDPVNATDDLVFDFENETQRKIYIALKHDNTAIYEQLACSVGVSPSTIKRNLKKLQALHLIKRKGSDKTGYWEIVQLPRE